MGNLSEVIGEIMRELDEKNIARESIVQASRSIIKASSGAIIALHSDNMEKAEEKLREARKHLDDVEKYVQRYPEYRYIGPLPQAYQEYAEAVLLYAIVHGRDYPSPNDLKVPPPYYLSGLADAMGEVRRLCLDYLRKGNVEKATNMLELMEGVYLALRPLDEPDTLTPGLRRRRDVLRRLVEETRRDVTAAVVNEKLKGAIRELLKELREKHG